MAYGAVINQDVIQRLVDDIAPSLGLDVMVINEDLELVAGTGKARKELGAYYGGGSLTERLLQTFQPYLTDRPGESEDCLNCARRAHCSYLAVSIYPVMLGKEVGGSLGLVASTERQKRLFYEKRDSLMKMASRLSFLIGSSLGETEAHHRMRILHGRLQALLRVVDEGLIMTDSNGTIAVINPCAENMLGVKSHSVIGRFITDLFPDIPFSNIIQEIQTGKTETIITFKNKTEFWGSIIPTFDCNGRLEGVALSFKKLHKTVRCDFLKCNSTLKTTYRKTAIPKIIGQSPSFLKVKERALKVAQGTSTVLIRGESGTGKEILALHIHSWSPRSKEPFVTINCSAIPGELLESELFGYEEGAFTGARKGGKPGKLEIADKGTVFLDEIGDMPLYLQAKVLRAIETKTFERVGGISPLNADVRIIAATNRNLEEAVKGGLFREDLYYRLNVIPLVVPPLRERPEDIVLLVDYFINKFSDEFRSNIRGIDEGALYVLLSYDWPGNVRELENAIEYAMNLEEGHNITITSLPKHIVPTLDLDSTRPRLEILESLAIQDGLRRFGTTVAGKQKTAEHLGISLATLYRRLRELDN